MPGLMAGENLKLTSRLKADIILSELEHNSKKIYFFFFFFPGERPGNFFVAKKYIPLYLIQFPLIF